MTKENLWSWYGSKDILRYVEFDSNGHIVQSSPKGEKESPNASEKMLEKYACTSCGITYDVGELVMATYKGKSFVTKLLPKTQTLKKRDTHVGVKRFVFDVELFGNICLNV